MTYQINQIFQKIKNVVVPEKLMLDTTICPYCASKNIVKRGWRVTERIRPL